MTICTVCGTVVASQDAGRVEAMPRYLLVRPWSASGDKTSRDKASDSIVALDPLGADRGEVVIVAQGSSCRQIPQTNGAAVDALIVGIVDEVDEVAQAEAGATGTMGYRKSAAGSDR